MNIVPEELLSEILAYALYLPSDFFLVFSGCLRWDVAGSQNLAGVHSALPDVDTRIQRTAVLLVCKQWLRIGSPLLYESLKLKTSKDVEAVHGLLSVNPALGRAIRRLRIESMYMQGLDKVVQYMPSVHTVFISVQKLETSPEASTVSSFVTAMQELNPTRAFLWKQHVGWTTRRLPIEELDRALGASLSRWTRLVRSVFLTHWLSSGT